MVFDMNFVLSVFSIFSLFVAVLYKLNGFLLVYCACSHLASTNSTMLASMCEYWSCALHSKLSRVPEISRCRAFTWIIVVPVNLVTRVVQGRYLAPPPELSGFHANGQAFKTEKHVRTGISLPPEISLPHRDISPHVNRL